MRKLKITFMIFIVLGIVGVITTFAVYEFNVHRMWEDMTQTSAYAKGYHQVKDVTRIDINARNGRVIINQHAYDFVRVEYHTREGHVYVTTTQTGTTLNIQQTRPRRFNIGVNFDNSRMYEINVWVPASVNIINTTTHNGRVNVTGLNLDRLQITSHNGAINVQNINANQIGVIAHNGRVNIANSDIGIIHVQSHNGNMTAYRVITNDITAINHNGRNNITIIGQQGDYAIRFITRNGSSRINGNRTNQTTIPGGYGTIHMETRNGRNDLRFMT